MTDTRHVFGSETDRIELWHLERESTIVLGESNVASLAKIEFAVCTQILGRTSVRSRNAIAELGTGDIAIIQPSATVQFEDVVRPASSLFVTVVASSAALARTSAWTNGAILKIDGNAPIGQLVSNFMHHATSALPLADQRTASKLIQTFGQLIAVAIDTAAPAISGHAQPRDIDIFTAATRYIETRLDDAALQIETIAQSLSTTERSLQKAFRDNATTVNEWIWSRRLEIARQRFDDPLFSGQTIRQIAFASGFANVAHFSRRYKAAFGLSPRAYRRGPGS